MSVDFLPYLTNQKFHFPLNQYSNSTIDYLLNNYVVSRVINPDKDNIFIFDWTLESAVNKHGYAEAAADVLAATLVNLGKDYSFLLSHLHFIGFSRGCVVNSETIQRLIYWKDNGMITDISLDPEIHMTTLDPHPAGHWTKWYPWLNVAVAMNDDEVNSWNIMHNLSRIGIVGWKGINSKVQYLDNYYQFLPTALFIGLNDYPGLNSSSNASNNNLTLLFILNPFDAHSLVHTWYFGTVDTLVNTDEFGNGPVIDRNGWYDNQGSTQGFYYSRNRNGFLSNISSIESDLVPISNDQKYRPKTILFNGDFTKGDDAIFERDSLPGWSYQDGSTSKRGGIFNPAALIDDSHNNLIHNSFYIPTAATEISFRIRVLEPIQRYFNPDILEIYLNNTLVHSVPIISFEWNYQWQAFEIPLSLVGTTAQLKFELNKNQTEPSSLLIDDVNFWKSNKINSTVACPVDFHIYDNLGNHTGPTSDTTYVEEIPGSEYYIYEDSTGDKIKTVYLEPLEGLGEYQFVIESQDSTSFFSYIIEDYSDTSRGTITFEFDSIAIEPNTVAMCTLNTNIQIPMLEVDLDGDGQIDTTMIPVIIESCFNKNISSGWNLLSVPFTTGQKLKTELFPTAVGPAYWFIPGQGYIVSDTLAPKKGYWLKFDETQNVDICGLITGDSINVKQGWNLIGVLDKFVPVSQISTIPPGIIASPFYGYDGNYYMTDTLSPGNGYWVKSNADGIILLNSQLAKKEETTFQLHSEWANITFTDASGNQMKLYFNEDANRELFVLPPMPPEEAFDIRFASDLMLESLKNESAIISISGAEYPITIRVDGVDLQIKDMINGNYLNETLNDGDEILISDSRINKIIINGNYSDQLPINFSLEQNYPNPFNPNTTISFSIPKEAQVNLSVYNILGEKVRELKNEMMKPGYYNVEFDASLLSSGVYLYRINAGDFVDIKKMILLK